jgi:hypothetical protein
LLQIQELHLKWFSQWWEDMISIFHCIHPSIKWCSREEEPDSYGYG